MNQRTYGQTAGVTSGYHVGGQAPQLVQHSAQMVAAQVPGANRAPGMQLVQAPLPQQMPPHIQQAMVVQQQQMVPPPHIQQAMAQAMTQQVPPHVQQAMAVQQQQVAQLVQQAQLQTMQAQAALDHVADTDALWARVIRSIMNGPAVIDARLFADISAAVLQTFGPETEAYEAMVEWSGLYADAVARAAQAPPAQIAQPVVQQQIPMPQQRPVPPPQMRAQQQQQQQRGFHSQQALEGVRSVGRRMGRPSILR